MNKNIIITRWCVGIFLSLVFAACVLVLALNRFGAGQTGGAEQTEAPGQSGSPEQSGTEGGGARLWSYLDGGSDPGSGNVWTTLRYDCSDWKTSDGPFHEQEGGSGVELDSVPAASYFFRREFESGDPSGVTAITFTIRYSEAVLVYLNGEIIYAGNVPPGGYSNSHEAGCSTQTGAVREESCLVTYLPSLVQGKNVLAVELHQAAADDGDAYFEMTYFNLLGEQIFEEPPQPLNVYLELGDDEEDVVVNLLSKEAASLETGYMTRSDYERGLQTSEDWDPFVRSAKRVLMGRTYDEEHSCYLYRAPLSLLRNSETYMYRVRHVGGYEYTEAFDFDFPASLSYDFALLRPGAVGETAKSLLEKANAAAIEGSGHGLAFYAAERSAVDCGSELISHVPIRLLGGEGSSSFVYKDVLFIVLDPADPSPERREQFIRSTMEGVQRRRTVVLLNEAWGTDARDAYAPLGVDLTLNAAAQDALLVSVSDGGLTVISIAE